MVRPLSSTNLTGSTVKMDIIKDSPAAMKTLALLRAINEPIKTER